eukprot:1159459_1
MKIFADIDLSTFGYEDDRMDRLRLDVNSTCNIFSRSKHSWLKGVVSKIWIDSDTNQEWLNVKYSDNKRKKIQRFSDALRIIPTKKLHSGINVESESEETCDQECDDPIAGCMQLKRLVVALMYYQHLDVQNSAHSQAIFMAFIH